jgi:hypothetical protein
MRFSRIHTLDRLPGIVGDFDRSATVELNANPVQGIR